MKGYIWKKRHDMEQIYCGNCEREGGADITTVLFDERAVMFRNDSRGIALNYETVQEALCCIRPAETGAAPAGSERKKKIKTDYQKKGKRKSDAKGKLFGRAGYQGDPERP